MNIIKDEILDEIIDFLKGSCVTLNDAIITHIDESYDEDDLTFDQLNKIDNEVFLCTECGWWSEISEAIEICGEYYCHDCKDSEDDKEE